ncbi:MAG: hypothetical protein JWR89_5137 [Tardiphaga sp.]|uniref:hypothetical protein n=1 Tax=Tardiphaga sp. TaxID=1926292 RepID=UPI0026170831|nr:hypothetical protein [Tardiphaga sp.]MDB5505235.1 hypothetical protein [Tardiphaga sp.]
MKNENGNLQTTNTTAIERLLKVARDTQSGDTIMKFNQGHFYIGDLDVTGREYVVAIDQLGHGHTVFGGGKVLGEEVSLVAEAEPPERPSGYDNTADWEKDSVGNPRDPVKFQYHCPMIDGETGAYAVFKTGSIGGMGSLGKLCAVYARNPLNGLPIVKLGSGSYKNKKHGGTTFYPDFIVVGFEPPTAPISGDAPPPRKPPKPDGTGSPAAVVNPGVIIDAVVLDKDMNDQVPF